MVAPETAAVVRVKGLAAAVRVAAGEEVEAATGEAVAAVKGAKEAGSALEATVAPRLREALSH